MQQWRWLKGLKIFIFFAQHVPFYIHSEVMFTIISVFKNSLKDGCIKKWGRVENLIRSRSDSLFASALYCLCDQVVIGRLKTRKEKYKSSFYPNCLSEQNKLEHELRPAPSFAVFKKKLLSKIPPPGKSVPPPSGKSVLGIHDLKGLSHATQPSVGLSTFNFHKFNHNFRDTINPMCPTSDGI